MKKTNIIINMITIIAILINTIAILEIVKNDGTELLLVHLLLIILLQIILNRVARILELNQWIKQRNVIIVIMTVIVPTLTVLLTVSKITEYSKILSYYTEEIIIEICIIIIITLGAALTRLISNKTKREMRTKKINKVDIIISIICIIVTIFNCVLAMNPTESSDGPAIEQTEMETRAFNSNLIPYEGDNQGANQVISLISIVKKSNESELEHQIELIKPEKIENSKKYCVELKYDEEKYINEIIITESEETIE